MALASHAKPWENSKSLDLKDYTVVKAKAAQSWLVDYITGSCLLYRDSDPAFRPHRPTISD